MGSIHEKNRGRKSRDTAPLKSSLYCPEQGGIQLSNIHYCPRLLTAKSLALPRTVLVLKYNYCLILNILKF